MVVTAALPVPTGQVACIGRVHEQHLVSCGLNGRAWSTNVAACCPPSLSAAVIKEKMVTMADIEVTEGAATEAMDTS